MSVSKVSKSSARKFLNHISFKIQEKLMNSKPENDEQLLEEGRELKKEILKWEAEFYVSFL